MKRELYALYVGYAVFYFASRVEAGMAAGAMSGALSTDGAANPEAPHIKVTLSQVSPRIERIVLDVPRRVRRAKHALSPAAHILAALEGGAE